MKERKNLFSGILIGALIGGIFGVVSSLLIINLQAAGQATDQQKRDRQQAALLASVRNSNLTFLMDNVLNKVDQELQNSPERALSIETISRVASLNHALSPYRSFEDDSLSDKPLSLERGQLLLALSVMDMDSASFAALKARAPFRKADLRGANLNGADLRGVNLYEADLRGASLYEAKLGGADLRGVNFWGANLKNADLSGADLQRANLSWADLHQAVLAGANMNGADLSCAKLQQADLSGTIMKLAILNEAFLNEATMVGTDLEVTELYKTNFSEADMSKAFLRGARLNEAVLRGTILQEANMEVKELHKASVREEDWLSKLDSWKVIGAKDIQDAYRVVPDMAGSGLFRIEKRE